MKRMKGFKVMIMFVAILTMATSASADLIYNNMGSSEAAYSQGSSVLVKGYDTYQAVAVAFTSPGNFTLSQLTIPLNVYSSSYPSTSRIDLLTDNGGVPDTTTPALESLTMPSLSATPTLKTIPSISHPQLLSGTTYWVAIFPTDGAPWPWTYVYWHLSSVATVAIGGSPFSMYWSGTWHDGNSYVPGLKIEGTPSSVPVPPTVWLLGSGLLGLFGLRRRFKK